MSETQEKHRKERSGEVISNKMTQTIVVRVKRRMKHPLYKKVITKFKKYYVHDAESVAQPGNHVRIRETRPISKLKRWVLVEVIR